MATYVTADLHLGHDRIVKFERTQYRTLEEHDKSIIDHINKVVMPDDTLYILGDVCFISATTKGKMVKLVKSIHGHKILVRGNHDKFSDTVALEMGFEKIYHGPVFYESPITSVCGKILLSHEPAKEAHNNPYCINVHGHVHNGKINLPNYYNVNIAQANYVPVSMTVYERIALAQCKSRQEQFKMEWYYNYYDIKEPGGNKNV